MLGHLARRAVLRPPVAVARRGLAKKKKQKSKKAPAPAAAAADGAGDDLFAADFDAPLLRGLETTVERLTETFKTMRGGAVNAELFERCRVEAYGAPQPLASVAHVAVASPTLVRIACFDPQLAPAVARAVGDLEGLSLNPSVSGGEVSVPVPRPSREQRAALAKAAAQAAEQARTRARTHRRDAHDRVKKLAAGASEDDVRAKKAEIDRLVDETTKEIARLTTEKQKAIESRE